MVTIVVDYDNNCVRIQPKDDSDYRLKAGRFDHKYSMVDMQDVLYEVINAAVGTGVSLQSQSDGDLHTIGEW